MLLFLVSIYSNQTIAQNDVQPVSYQVVSCMSNVYKTSSVQVGFTVGEVFVGGGESADGTLSLFEGFQCPTAIFNSAHRLFADFFLEGAYDANGLMKTYLSTSGAFPLQQPFNVEPYYYQGTELLTEVTPNMVDWVLIEARTGTPNLTGNKGTTTVETQAGILLEDGTLVGPNGLDGLAFSNLEDGQPYHFCIRHRNHLDVLTAQPVIASSIMDVDLTTSTDQAFGLYQLKLSDDNRPLLFAGDYNQDGIIQTTDYDFWSANPAMNAVYWPTDGNLDGVVQSTDYDTWFYNKAKIGSIEIGY